MTTEESSEMSSTDPYWLVRISSRFESEKGPESGRAAEIVAVESSEKPFLVIFSQMQRITTWSILISQYIYDIEHAALS
jgi:hypothetical protein